MGVKPGKTLQSTAKSAGNCRNRRNRPKMARTLRRIKICWTRSARARSARARAFWSKCNLVRQAQMQHLVCAKWRWQRAGNLYERRASGFLVGCSTCAPLRASFRASGEMRSAHLQVRRSGTAQSAQRCAGWPMRWTLRALVAAQSAEPSADRAGQSAHWRRAIRAPVRAPFRASCRMRSAQRRAHGSAQRCAHCSAHGCAEQSAHRAECAPRIYRCADQALRIYRCANQASVVQAVRPFSPRRRAQDAWGWKNGESPPWAPPGGASFSARKHHAYKVCVSFQVG
jgi:hypothetical protein